ncbi:hypothetical protein [Nocardia aurea]|uniref:Uncharacterized protein n=1 Tax=Nocardia aurea TaxID=2144174 RepID=A0ABV3FZ60_9NOCA
MPVDPDARRFVEARRSVGANWKVRDKPICRCQQNYRCSSVTPIEMSALVEVSVPTESFVLVGLSVAAEPSD